MEGRERRCLLVKIVFAILGMISGISIFASFLHYKNYSAAIWGLLSAIFASINLNLHVLYRRRALHLKHTPESLRVVKLSGVILSIAALIAAAIYFILVAVYHEGYKIDGFAPAGIFALLTLKWTVMLYFTGNKYEKFLRTSPGEMPSRGPYQSFE